MYTYNQSTIVLPVSEVELSLGQNVGFTVEAHGGRPEPKCKWRVVDGKGEGVFVDGEKERKI